MRGGGFFSNLLTSQSRVASCLRETAPKMAVPLNHVSITSIRHRAMTSGTHAPSKIFMTLAAKNTCSMNSNGTINAAACQIGQCHRFQKTKNGVNAVRIHDARTATPDAAASAAERLKTVTKSSTTITSSQLTQAT